MYHTVNIHDAKTHFSELVNAAAKGQEIIIAKAGVPAARLVALAPSQNVRHFGSLKGKITFRDDFNDPLPDDMLDAFEGQL